MWEFVPPATDCLWYDISPSGEEVCALNKVPLNTIEAPCSFCKDYKKFDKEALPNGTHNKRSPL